MNIDLAELLTHPAFMLTVILGLDMMFGDPVYRLHPVRLTGNLLSWYETKLRNSGLNSKAGGFLLVVFLILSTLLVSTGIFKVLEYIHWSLSWFWYVYLGWSFLALGDLLAHARNVAEAMANENLPQAKLHVGKLVGRDTKLMDLPACGRATVESVGENFNDGVLAPLFFFCLFGIPGMLIYKVVNTLDSMVGYKNERYQDFGWCSAKLDDFLSCIPARISWLLLSGTAAMYPQLSGINALKAGWKDHFKLPSYNAGWCEATVAGALKLKLCGPIWREGKLAHNVWLGRQNDREGATVRDIQLANSLALTSTLIVTGFVILVLCFSGFLPIFSR
ncbi:MAG: Cobalamin biosynthesis protein CobD [Deltaproteobacteria bacterium]|nr:Cobalamin biosynthesis protein CobD [Deltaproteobacteria bacterium]